MPDTIVSKSARWDSKLNSWVTTTTLESLGSFPAIPTTAVNATKSFDDGVYRCTYEDVGDNTGTTPAPPPSSNTSYEINTTTSTEPLKSFWKFAPGQPWFLSASDLAIIADCESGAKKYSDYTAAGSGSDGLRSYCILFGKGIESVLKPSITLSISADENTLPSMADIGKVATGLTGTPTLPTGGNWLLTGMTASALSNGKWRISREYRASGQLGWEPTLYT
jgi:hypothetical protein